MTLNGFLREVGAAQRRAARTEERRQRAHARAIKLQAKIDELERAAEEVAEYQEKITQLTGVHRTVGEEVDWNEIANKPPLVEPKRASKWRDAAVAERDRFQPSFFQRLFGSETKIRAKLEEAIVEGEKRDEVSHQGAQKLYRGQTEEWKRSTGLARDVLRGDANAYGLALEELEPLAEMQDMGCGIELKFPDMQTAEIVLSVQSDAVVPRESKSLMKSGKLSVKVLPESKFNELYQDYVCGCALRIARELFATLPLKRVSVNVTTRMLDSASGHMKELTVLSVAMPKATIDGMNFHAVDASDSMRLFPHRMGFKRSAGFSEVEPLARTEYPSISAG